MAPAKLRRLPKDSPLDDIIRVLEEDGCIVITDFTTEEKLDQAKSEVDPWLDKQSGSSVGALQGKTRTLVRLMSRSPTIRESFYLDPVYQSLCQYFLSRETTHWYYDSETQKSEAVTTTSHPLLSIGIVFDVPPGTPAQGLHRDDKNHHWRRHSDRRQEGYKRGQDCLLGLFVPGVDTKKENGATRVVPGSHLWGDGRPDLLEDDDLTTDAEMKRGEAFIMLGGCYHGAGEYKDDGEKGEKEKKNRTVYAMFSCLGTMRQEEVPWLAYDVDEVRGWSDTMKLRLGWRWSEPNLGWVDLMSPDEYFAGQQQK